MVFSGVNWGSWVLLGYCTIPDFFSGEVNGGDVAGGVDALTTALTSSAERIIGDGLLSRFSGDAAGLAGGAATGWDGAVTGWAGAVTGSFGVAAGSEVSGGGSDVSATGGAVVATGSENVGAGGVPPGAGSA